MSFEIRTGYFDARKIAASGQVFRMYEAAPGKFDIYSADKHLRLCELRDSAAESNDRGGCGYSDCPGSLVPETVILRLYCPEKDLRYWRRYLDLDRDYEAVIRLVDAKDGYLRSCCEAGRGIRILRQNTWEMMISFIISQQKQIPSIRKCIEGLCAKLGSRMESRYAFPTAEQIAAAGPAGVQGLSLGYRERYIYETAVQFLDHGIPDETLAAMPYEDAKKYLLSFTGIGEKVANCILLFGAGFVDAFPIDTHIKDILYREYYLPNLDGKTPVPQDKLTMRDYERLTEEHFARYSGVRGIVQQWIFANEVAPK
jgi:N-glycosylase/DNA lyase